MKMEELKRKYESGEYICVVPLDYHGHWQIINDPYFTEFGEEVLIHNSDKYALEHYLNDGKVYQVNEYNERCDVTDSFIECYNESNIYEIKQDQPKTQMYLQPIYEELEDAVIELLSIIDSELFDITKDMVAVYNVRKVLERIDAYYEESKE